MNNKKEDEKVRAKYREVPVTELPASDQESAENESSIEEKLVVSHSQARWLRIGEQLGQWLLSILRGKN